MWERASASRCGNRFSSQLTKKNTRTFFFFVNSAKPKYAYSAMDPGYTEKNPLDLAYILNRFKRFEYRINQLGFCAYIEPI